MLPFLFNLSGSIPRTKKTTGVIPVVHMSAAHIHHRLPDGNLYFVDSLETPSDSQERMQHLASDTPTSRTRSVTNRIYPINIGTAVQQISNFY
jgi:hypothetical protein